MSLGVLEIFSALRDSPLIHYTFNSLDKVVSLSPIKNGLRLTTSLHPIVAHEGHSYKVLVGHPNSIRIFYHIFRCDNLLKS